MSAASTGVKAGCVWTDRLMCRIDPLLSWGFELRTPWTSYRSRVPVKRASELQKEIFFGDKIDRDVATNVDAKKIAVLHMPEEF